MKRTIVARANHSVRTVVAFAFAAFATSISCARLTPKKLFGWDGVGSTTTTFSFLSRSRGKGRCDLSNIHSWKKSKTPDQERAVSKREHALDYGPATAVLSGALQPTAKSKAGVSSISGSMPRTEREKAYPRFFARSE
jgi:hypothetical protein